MELPAALTHWAAQLELFPRELAGSLGPLVLSLDRLIGQPRLRDERGLGDPDGFDGLTIRGPYERLLLTDWLLASEVPDEFVRRAVMNEHSFLRLVHRSPAGARLSAALFDAGPDQWGTPRIAHIAALIVLHRRASSAGYRFLWGVAQSAPSEGAILSDVTPATIKHLLDTRSPRPLTDADVSAWRTAFGAGEALDDWWIISGRRTGSLPSAKEASLLVLEDVYDPAPPRRITARIRKADGIASPETPLELPEDRVCTRLLRDPFETAVTAPVRQPSRFTPASNFVFPLSGRKLLARSRNNSLISFPIPNSPRATAGIPRQYRSMYGTPIVAASRIGKATVVATITTGGDTLRIETFGGKGTLPSGDFPFMENTDSSPTPFQYSSAPSSHLGVCEVAQSARAHADLMVLLPSGDLIRALRDDKISAAIRVDVRVAAMAPTYQGIAYLQANNDHFLLMDNESRTPKRLRKFPRGGGGRAFFGEGQYYSGIQYGQLAVEEDFGRWRIVRGDDDTILAVPLEMRPVGLLTGEPRLVLLGGDNRSLHLLSATGTRLITQAATPIEEVGVGAGDLDVIAYATQAGELVIYSLIHNEVVYRLLPDDNVQPSLPYLEAPEVE